MRFYSDETFSYIAGYTSGGIPYGVRWDEVEEESYIEVNSEDRKKEEVLDINDDNIPF